ncbi:hypothetical protein AAG906_029675 [Vitis piasezkii]
MQEKESLREFVKWFGQAILQVESYSMDVVLQIFKWSICRGTPFFKSLAKKPPVTMDNLFRRANKYSMLEDDVCTTTQQILVTSQPAKNDAIRNPKTVSQRRQSSRGQDEQCQPDQSNFTPLNVSYEKLLPMIRELSDFRWPEPLKTNPAKRDRNRKCVYHKEHGHTTEQCRSLHYLYVRSEGQSGKHPRVHPPRLLQLLIPPRVVINYIHGGPLNEEYNSKRKRQRLL